MGFNAAITIARRAKAAEYRDAVAEIAVKIFLISLEKADDIRVDYLSDTLKVDGLIERSILTAKMLYNEFDSIRDIRDIDETNAERVGETGELTERPA